MSDLTMYGGGFMAVLILWVALRNARRKREQGGAAPPKDNPKD